MFSSSCPLAHHLLFKPPLRNLHALLLTESFLPLSSPSPLPFQCPSPPISASRVSLFTIPGALHSNLASIDAHSPFPTNPSIIHFHLFLPNVPLLSSSHSPLLLFLHSDRIAPIPHRAVSVREPSPHSQDSAAGRGSQAIERPAHTVPEGALTH